MEPAGTLVLKRPVTWRRVSRVVNGWVEETMNRLRGGAHCTLYDSRDGE